MKGRGKTFEKHRRTERNERVRLGIRSTTKVTVEITGKEGESKQRLNGGVMRPSVHTGASLDRVGSYVDKIYGTQGHINGRRNKPRRTLTLGNQVRRKTRKRVEDKVTKDSQRVSKQRVRQRMGGLWDRRNQEMRKAQRKVRKDESSGSVLDTTGKRALRIEGRDRYRRVRHREVRSNGMKRRSRVKDHARGKHRQSWVSMDNYEDEPRRQGIKKKEREGLKARYEEVAVERKTGRERAIGERKGRRKEGTHSKGMTEKRQDIRDKAEGVLKGREDTQGGYGRREHTKVGYRSETEDKEGKE